MNPIMREDGVFNGVVGSSMDEERVYRTVLVKSSSPLINRQDLTIHFQSRKNGGGEVEELILHQNGSAVITFKEEKVAKSVQKIEQKLDGILLTVEPYANHHEEMQYFEVFSKVSAMVNPEKINRTFEETEALIKKLQEEIKVEFTKPQHKPDVFILYGSFKQIHESRRLLQKMLSKDRAVLNGNHSIKKDAETPGLADVPIAMQNGIKFHRNNGVEPLAENDSQSSVEKRSYESSMKTLRKKEVLQKEGSCNDFFLDKEYVPKEDIKGFPSKDPNVAPAKRLKENETPVKPKGSTQVLSLPKGDIGGKDSKSKADKDSSRYLKEKSEKKAGNLQKAAYVVTYKGSAPSGEKTLDFRKLEISNKVWYIFAKMYEKELKRIMEEFSVNIEPDDNNSVAVIKPLNKCNEKKSQMAVRKLSELYEEAKSKMDSVCFALADPEKKEDDKELRKTVLEVKKKFSFIRLERTADRQSWEIFGETYEVQKAVKFLEERVKLQRKKPKVDDEEIEDTDSEEESDDADKKYSDDVSDGVDDEDDHGDDYNEKLECYLGKVKLSVYKGDITEENCDAIVNAANERLYHGAGVAKAIVSKGGPSIQDECKRIINSKGKLKVGEAIISHSGNLKCKMIIHAVGPNWKEDKGETGKALLKKVCKESLAQAQKYSFKTIAFPAISSGIFGMPKTICAQVMFDVAEEYSKGITSSSQFGLLDIKFVNNDVKTMKVFRKEFKARYGDGVPILKSEDAVTSNQFGNDAILGVEDKIKVKTEAMKSEAVPKHTDSLSFTNEARYKHEIFSKKQRNGPFLSFGVEKPSQDSLRPAPVNKEKTRDQKHQTNNMVNHDVLPRNKESRKKSDSRNQSLVKSFSFSGGARPKQRLDRVSNKIKGHQHLPSSPTKTEEEPIAECPICKDKMKQPTTLPKCKHTFCKTCLDRALQQSPICPYCREPQSGKQIRPTQGTNGYGVNQFRLFEFDYYELQQNQDFIHSGNQDPFDLPFGHPRPSRMAYPKEEDEDVFSGFRGQTRLSQQGNRPMTNDDRSFNGHVQQHFGFTGKRRERRRMQRGPQPHGSMMHRQEQFSLPGYEDCGTLVIQYSFNGGIQGPDHPNPGQRYDGTNRSAYLPDCPEGRKVLKLLQQAFDAGLIFKIGRSMTSKLDNQIIWADISHKTSTNGGVVNYGYPDPTYLSDVTQQLQKALRR